MADFRMIMKGQVFFFLGFFYVLIMSYILPPIIDVGESLFPSNDLQAIAWLFALIFYLFLAMIYPINMIYNGITTPTDPKINPFMQIIGSVFLFFLAIILTVKGWYIITSLSEVVSGDILLTVIFWMGLLTS